MPVMLVRPVILTKEQIYALDDVNLMLMVVCIRSAPNFHDSDLSDFEKRFAQSVPESYADNGRITWKQRRSARLLVHHAMQIIGRELDAKELRAKYAEIARGEQEES